VLVSDVQNYNLQFLMNLVPIVKCILCCVYTSSGLYSYVKHVVVPLCERSCGLLDVGVGAGYKVNYDN
jgi:hypothetical protein